MGNTQQSNQLKVKRHVSMEGFVILCLGGFLTVSIIGFISLIAKGKDEMVDTPKEHYNYRLCTFSRIVYFTALMASFIMPVYLALHFSSAPYFLKLFFASPIFVFLMQNIMAHKLREHNISLHFIAMCAAILYFGVIFYEQNTPYWIDGDITFVLSIFYAFVGFYAFFAWMTALSNRNE